MEHAYTDFDTAQVIQAERSRYQRQRKLSELAIILLLLVLISWKASTFLPRPKPLDDAGTISVPIERPIATAPENEAGDPKDLLRLLPLLKALERLKDLEKLKYLK